jgi:hypothetical protein
MSSSIYPWRTARVDRFAALDNGRSKMLKDSRFRDSQSWLFSSQWIRLEASDLYPG